MLIKAELTNFQSHPNTVVEFSPFVNAICGDSDHGKSGLLRGLIWALTNKPTGMGNVSDWIRTEKGAIKANQRCTVKLITPKGGVTRERSSTFNGYHMDGEAEPLAAVRDTVPPGIQQFFNVSELNIQQQHDSHFMITMSPPEAARFLNRLVNLSEIDACVSKVEGKKRAAEADVIRLTKECAALDAKLPQWEWVESAEELLPKLQAMDAKIKVLQARIPGATQSVQKWAELKAFTDKSNQRLVEIQGVQLQLGQLKGMIATTCKIINQMDSSLREHQACQEIYNHTHPQLTHIAGILPQLRPMVDSIQSIGRTVASLQTSLDSHGKVYGIAQKAPLLALGLKVNGLQEVYSQYIRLTGRTRKMQDDLQQWGGLKLDKLEGLHKVIAIATQTVTPLPRMARVITGGRATLESTRESIEAFHGQQRIIAKSKQDLDQLKSQLPTVCPTCGQAWEHTHQEP